MTSTSSIEQATFVVPCFNEEHRLEADQFVEFMKHAKQLRMIFVDDGSSDRTLDVLSEIRSAVGGDCVTVLTLDRNRGKAEATRQGLLCALSTLASDDQTVQLVGYLDADLATPLNQLTRMVDVARRNAAVDVVFGSRIPLAGHKIERTASRRLLGRVFSFAASRCVGLSLHDTQCGGKLFRVNQCFRQLCLKPFSSRWFFDVEILARMRTLAGPAYSAKVFEMPLESWCEIGGSKLKAGDFLQAPWELLRIFVNYRVRTWELPSVSDPLAIPIARAVVAGEEQSMILEFPQPPVTRIDDANAA